MCQQHQCDDESNPLQHSNCTPAPARALAPAASNGSFPWHLPIYDAHCHPTDTMESITNLETMRTSALSIMATRSQDQQLVADVASLHGGVKDRASLHGRQINDDGLGSVVTIKKHPEAQAVQDSYSHSYISSCKIIPSFGWHPWFSHQMYDDHTPDPTYTALGENDDAADDAALLFAKRKHYQAVLVPAPDKDEFIASLPTPTPLSAFVHSTKSRLESHPIAIIGEIGLDKAFRLPESWHPKLAASRDNGLTPGNREGRRLSPYKVSMQHQQSILRAQLRLAGEFGLPVSVHGVQAHGTLYDTVSSSWTGHEKHMPSRKEKRKMALEAKDESPDNGAEPAQVDGKPYPPRVCLHSYSGSVEGLKQWLRPTIPAEIYISFSTAVNLGTHSTRAKVHEVIRAVPANRLLVESDLHIAGKEMEAALEDMYRIVCAAKGWSLEEGVKTIAKNFEDFIFG